MASAWGLREVGVAFGHFLILLAACWVSTALGAAAPPVTLPGAAQSGRGFSVSVGAASEYVVHGLARSQGQPVVNASLGYGLGNGWQLGAHASTMNLNRGPGATFELGYYLGYRRAVGDDWELGASVASYEFWKDTAFLSYDYAEATVEASWRGLVTARLQHSPDYSLVSRLGPAREFDTFTGELQLNYPLRPNVQLSAAVGHYDLRDGFGFGYYYWSAGAVASRGRVSLALNYVGVDSSAKAMFNSRFTRDKLIATMAWRAY